jgi:hypothetical protein
LAPAEPPVSVLVEESVVEGEFRTMYPPPPPPPPAAVLTPLLPLPPTTDKVEPAASVKEAED